MDLADLPVPQQRGPNMGLQKNAAGWRQQFLKQRPDAILSCPADKREKGYIDVKQATRFVRDNHRAGQLVQQIHGRGLAFASGSDASVIKVVTHGVDHEGWVAHMCAMAGNVEHLQCAARQVCMEILPDGKWGQSVAAVLQ